MGFGVSNSLTYQLSQSFGLGMGHTLALHPRIPDPSTRHNIQAFFILQHPRQRVTPFFKFGVSNTIGGETLGYGPHLGFGLNIISSGTFSLFQETTLNMVFPGRAVDGQDLSGGFDSIGTVGVGIKITDLGGFFGTRNIGLEDIFSSAEATNYRVKPGETVRFSTGAKDEDQVDFEWDFGDGFSENGKSVDHIFEQSGLYEVNLAAQNAGVREEKRVFISVQSEALAVAVDNLELEAFDLVTQNVQTIEGRLVQYRPFLTSNTDDESSTEINTADDSEDNTGDDIAVNNPNSESDPEDSEVVEPEDTQITQAPKRTRVIILDGVRIEEEIPEDELPKETEPVAVIEPIIEPVNEPVNEPVVETAEETANNPETEVDPMVAEVAEAIEEESIDPIVADSTESSETTEPAVVDPPKEESDPISPVEDEEEAEATSNEIAEESTEESENAAIETTIIIVDGQEVEVETSSIDDPDPLPITEPTRDPESEIETESISIDRKELEEGVFTWVLAVYDSALEAESTANQIGANTFIIEMKPEYEMYSIFRFHKKDLPVQTSYLTSYGAYESKQEAIDAIDVIPANFQARPFMMEVRRY